MAVAMAAKAASQEEAPQKKCKKKLIVIVLVAVMAVAAVYLFVLKPKGGGQPAAPKPGSIVALDPIQVNLASGHYLKIGIALQLVEGTEEADGSKALDAAISLFSNQSIDKVASSDQREKFKEKLTKTLTKEYEGEVMGVYFTTFVTQ